jgi:hypothetical protein
MRASGVGKEVTQVGLSRVYYFGGCRLVAAWLQPSVPCHLASGLPLTFHHEHINSFFPSSMVNGNGNPGSQSSHHIEIYQIHLTLQRFSENGHFFQRRKTLVSV